MAKLSLSQQLDELVNAIITQGDSRAESALPPADPSLAALVRITADLRDLPREEFKARLKTDLERRASMTTPAKPAPEKSKVNPFPEGYHTAMPYLMVRGAASAIEFYKKAFGATEVMRFAQPDGKIGHAEIRIGDSVVMLADEFPEMGLRSPQSLGGSPVCIVLHVEDVDAVAKRAVAAGARVLRPVQDQFYGDRSGKLTDPFGHVWNIATHKEDVSPEEVQKRFEALIRHQGGKQKGEPTTAVKTVKPIPEGFHTVTPYLRVQGAAQLIDFLKQAFGAAELLRTTGPGGGIHAEVRIGDSILMIGGGEALRGTPMPTALHFYVPNADQVYERALQAGAESLHEVVDQDYGDREASVKDPSGNHWYIATHKLTSSYVPEGLRTVTPYLHPRGADKLIAFLKEAFGAEEAARHAGPDGSIVHAKVRIGDSMIEMGEAHGPIQPMPTMFYLYVEDCDALYKRALQAGATSISKPVDQPYGDRNAGVKDPFGNDWYIATHIKDVPLS